MAATGRPLGGHCARALATIIWLFAGHPAPLQGIQRSIIWLCVASPLPQQSMLQASAISIPAPIGQPPCAPNSKWESPTLTGGEGAAQLRALQVAPTNSQPELHSCQNAGVLYSALC